MAKYRSCARPAFGGLFDQFISVDHKARKIAEFIEGIDLQEFDLVYRNDSRGRSAFPVKSLIKIQVYSHLEGIQSTRRIEQYCRENVVYRFLCADDPPDHTTISRFWKRFQKQLKSLFQKVLDIALNHNLVGFEHISGDGVRLGSMGSRAMLFDLKNANRHLKSIRRKQKEGRKTNDDLGIKLEKALPKLERISKERNKNIKEHTTYCHLTEPDARLIKKRTQFMSGYNAQAMVDKKNGIVLYPAIFCNSFDRHNGKPILSAVVDRFPSKAIERTHFTFDNGYEDEEFLAYAEEKQLNVFVPIKDPDKPNLLGKKKPKTTKYSPKYSLKRDAYICFDNHIIPFRRKQWIKGKAYAVYEKTCTHCKVNDKCIQNGDKRKRKKINRPLPKEDRKEDIAEAKFTTMKYRIGMYDKMKSDESRQIYANRVATVEPVFAQIEANRGFRRFSVWGKKKVDAQWDFVCTVHNIICLINRAKAVDKSLEHRRNGT